MKRASALMPAQESGRAPAGRRPSRPVVERIAGWSAGHRTIALVSWLLLVAVAFAIGSQLGTRSLPSYDPGPAGQAERVLNRPGVIQRPAESVLIRARSGDRTVASDPELRQAARQVVAALVKLPGAATGIRSPLAGGRGLVSADSRSELDDLFQGVSDRRRGVSA